MRNRRLILCYLCYCLLFIPAVFSAASDHSAISPGANGIDATEYAVIIDDVIIPYKNYSQALKEAIQKIQVNQGVNLTISENHQLLALTKKNILTDLIDQYLIQRSAKKFGVQITEKEIAAQLKTIKSSYQNEKEFLADLAAEGITLPEIVANISSQVLKEKITRKILENITISKGEIANYLAQDPEHGKGMEKRLVRQIVVNDRESAQLVRKHFFAGESFEVLATMYSTDAETAESGGNLGYIALNMLPERAQKDVRRLKKGEITKAIEIDDEYYIFQIGDILGLDQKKQEALRRYLLQEKQEEFFAKWLERQKKQSEITLNPELRAYYTFDSNALGAQESLPPEVPTATAQP